MRPGSSASSDVTVLSQHRVSSSKTVRPRASCSGRRIGHAVRTWSYNINYQITIIMQPLTLFRISEK